MQRSTKGIPGRANHSALSRQCCGGWVKSLLIWLVAGTIMLSACGSGSSSSGSPQSAALSGNWQFTMTLPGGSGGGLQGGFLLQNNGAVTGQAAYSVADPNSLPCNAGTTTITGTVSGSTVTLTAV